MLGVCLSFGAFYTIGGSKPAMTEWEENYSSGKSRESAEFLVSTTEVATSFKPFSSL